MNGKAKGKDYYYRSTDSYLPTAIGLTREKLVIGKFHSTSSDSTVNAAAMQLCSKARGKGLERHDPRPRAILLINSEEKMQSEYALAR